MTTRLWSVVFDASDYVAQAQWWADALGWRFAEQYVQYNEGVAQSNDGAGIELIFVPVPEPKISKNRIHLDIAAADESERNGIVQRLLASGAHHVDVGQPKDAKWTVLADAEGNEFCVWPGSRRDDGALYAISLDVEDAAATGRFWRSAAGWPIVFEGNRGDEHTVMLQSPDRNGPLLTVSGPPPDFEPKRGKNRVHLDVAPYAGDDQDADVERLVALGARRIDIGQGEVSWVVMADPEGNEFCVLTPR